MTKPVSVPNSFTSVTSASGAQLDADFTALANAINDPNTYTNYLVDTGAANAYVVTFPAGSVPAAYAAGLQVEFKVTNTNTGSSTINVNGLGVVNILNSDGTAVGAGQISGVVCIVHNGSVFQLLGVNGGGQSWTTNQRPNYKNTDTVSTTTSYTFDGSNASGKGQITLITFTNAITVTMAAPTNVIEGMPYTMLLKAGDTSARTFAWNTAYKNTPPTSGTLVSGAIDSLNFIGGASNTMIYNGGTVGT